MRRNIYSTYLHFPLFMWPCFTKKVGKYSIHSAHLGKISVRRNRSKRSRSNSWQRPGILFQDIHDSGQIIATSRDRKTPQMVVIVREMGPLISGKSRLVKYDFIWPDDSKVVSTHRTGTHPKQPLPTGYKRIPFIVG